MDFIKSLSKWRGRRVLVALSGGADSVALLLLMQGAGADVLAAHFEHGIRGADSLRDAAFCRALCDRLEVPYTEGSADVPAERRGGEGIESAARRLRYAFLEDARARLGAEKIALGHHMEDQAETVLMHLLRGAGGDGLRGMRAERGNLIRPLLHLRKADLLAYLAQRGEAHCFDATNAEPMTPRNRLRNEALPVLTSIYPAAVEAIARHAAIAGAEGDLLERMAEDWLQAHVDGARLRVESPPHAAILRRALRRWLGEAEMDFEAISSLERLCNLPRGTVQLPGGLRAERSGEWLYLLGDSEKRPKSQMLQIPGLTVLEGICEMRVEHSEPTPVCNNPLCQVLSERALRGAALRTRENGDRIRPFGMAGRKLLSDYMIDRKLDRPLRDALPILAVGKNVLWAVGLGISEDARAVEGEKAVRLTCRMLHGYFPYEGRSGGFSYAE